jgi:hypothetical protein
VTPAEFRAIFPEFSDSGKFPDARVQFYLDLAEDAINPDVWVNSYTHGVALYTAHYLAQSVAAATSASGLAGGAVASKSIGDVSVSYEGNAESGAAFWQSTTYGKQYWQIQKRFGRAAIQLV